MSHHMFGDLGLPETPTPAPMFATGIGSHDLFGLANTSESSPSTGSLQSGGSISDGFSDWSSPFDIDSVPKRIVDRVIAHASSETLLRVRNKAYLEARQRAQWCANQHGAASSQVDNVQLVEAIRTMQDSLNEIKDAVVKDRVEDPDAILPLLECNPSLQFYSEEAWKKAKAGGKGGSSLFVTPPGGFNKQNGFMETVEGEPMSETRLGQLRTALIQCYNYIDRFPEQFTGRRIAIWKGDSDISHVEFIRRKLYPAFPELRLCESHWKLNEFLIQHYPSWQKNHGVGAKVKDEIKEETPAPRHQIPSKRTATDVDSSDQSSSPASNDVDMAGPGVIDTAAFAGADTAPASGTTSAQDHRPQPQRKRPKLVLPNPIAHAAVKSTTREELLADGGKKSNVPGKAPEASAGAPSVSNTVSEPCVPAATSNATSIPISDPTSTVTPSLVPTHGSGSPLESPPESSHTGPVVIEDTMTSEPVPASGTGPVLATMTTGPSCESPLPSVVDETNPILPVASTSSDTGLQTSGITQPKLDLAVSSAAVDKVTGKGLARRVWLGENPTKSEKDFETYWKEQTKKEPETFAKEWNKTARQHNAQNKHKTTSKASTRGSRTKRGTVGAIA